MKKTLHILIACIFLLGCSDKEAESEARYDTGFGDGYAVGYNTTCKIRATIVEGDWEDPDYSRGYNDGYKHGAIDCRRQNDL
jgi:hypothetical protein